jgi:hypothetical protein
VPPDVAAVSGDPVLFINPRVIGFADMAVTTHAVHFTHLDMSHVGEKHAVRLPCIDQPRDFATFGHVFVVKFFLFRCLSHDLLVAFEAIAQLGDTGEGAVLPEIMTAVAAAAHLFHVKLVIEIDGLRLLGVQQFWKNDPPQNHAEGQPNEEEQKNGATGVVGGIRGLDMRFFVYGTHGHSVTVLKWWFWLLRSELNTSPLTV